MNSKVVITTDSPADLSAELETRYVYMSCRCMLISEENRTATE